MVFLAFEIILNKCSTDIARRMSLGTILLLLLSLSSALVQHADFVFVDAREMDDFHSNKWMIESRVVPVLDRGGIGVIPTDTCYSFVAKLSCQNAVDRLLALKKATKYKYKKPLSIICKDLKSISKLTEQHYNKHIYNILKQHLPGPYTFILPASKIIPKIILRDRMRGGRPLRWRRNEIGVRIPNDLCVNLLMSKLDQPLLCGSVPGHPEDWLGLDLPSLNDIKSDNIDNTEFEYMPKDKLFPSEGISALYPWTSQVDFIIDGGMRGEPIATSTATPDDASGLTTVVDLTSGESVIVRKGKGKVFDL